MKEIVLELIKAAQEKLKYPILKIYIVVLILYNWMFYLIISCQLMQSK